MNFEFNLKYVHFLEYEFWFSWVCGLILLFFVFAILVTICCLFKWIVLDPLFERFCDKHGYIKENLDDKSTAYYMTRAEWKDYSDYKIRLKNEVLKNE